MTVSNFLLSHSATFSCQQNVMLVHQLQRLQQQKTACHVGAIWYGKKTNSSFLQYWNSEGQKSNGVKSF